MQGYQHTGPIDCNGPFNTEGLKGKTAIVTGGKAHHEYFLSNITLIDIDDATGASGLGEAYVRALVNSGYETNNSPGIETIAINQLKI